MSIEHRGTEPTKELRKPTLEDLPVMADFNEQAWVDTYVNEGHGITETLIREYWAQLRSINPELIRKKYEDDFRDDKQFWRIISAGDRIIGLIRVTKKNISYTSEQETQHIEAYFVEKEEKGKGYGRELMEAFTESEWFDPSLPVTLEVDPDTPAIELYERLQFTTIPGSDHPYEKLMPIPMVTMYKPPVLKENSDEV